MPFNDNISQVWDLQAIEKEKEQAVSMVKDWLKELDTATKAVKVSMNGLGSDNSLVELADNTKKVTEAVSKQSKAVSELEKAKARLVKAQSDEAKQLAALQLQIIEQNRQNKISAAIDKEKEGSLLRLRAELRKAQSEWDKLSKSERDNVAIGGQLKTNLDNLTKEVKELEEATGRHQRSVGNYAKGFNGLQNSINQVAREMPSFANSVQTGFMALSNNLPMLADEIRNVRLENAKLTAEGKPTTSVLKQVASSIFNWQTALIGVITLLTFKGQDIWNYFTKGGEAVGSADKALKKYKDSIESISEASRATAAEEIAHIRVLEKLATTTDTSTKAKEAQKRAIDELQRLYPQTLKNYSDEEIAAGKVRDVLNELTEAIVAKAAAQAAEKKFAAASEKVYDLELARRKVSDELIEGYNEQTKADKIIAKNADDRERRGIAQASAQEKVTQAKHDQAEIEKELAAAQKEQLGYLQDAQDFAQKAGKAFVNETPDKKEKVKKDKTLPNLHKRLDAGITEEEVNRSIFAILGSARTNALREIEENIANIVDMETAAFQKIEEEYQTGKISFEEYEQAKLDVTNTYKKARLESEIAGLKDLLNNVHLTGEERLRFERQLNDLEVKLVEDANKKKLEAAKIYNAERKRLAEETKQRLVALEMQVLDAALEVSNAIIGNKYRGLEEEQRVNEQQTAEKLDQIDKLQIADDEKEARKRVVEEESLKQKEAIDKKKADLEKRSFLIEQAAAIAKVWINTAQESAKVTAQAAVLASNPVTAALAPNALAQLGVIAASGAIATGLIGAQILAYANGTPEGGHPGGAAMIGDGGEPELVKEPSGKMWWSPSTPTVIPDMAKGTEVTPLSHLIDMASAGIGMSAGTIAMMKQKDPDFGKHADRIVNAITNKPEMRIHNHANGERTIIEKRGNTTLTYLRKRF